MKTVTMNDFDSLYRQYGPMVLRRCKFLLKDEDKAVDAMQDVFVRIIERREKITSLCSSFFYTVATRVCLNRIRSDKLRSGPDFEAVSMTIEDNASQLDEEKVDAGMILDCIFSDMKDEKSRQIAVLHFVDGYTLQETAAAMKMSVSGVRKRLDGLKAKAKKIGGV